MKSITMLLSCALLSLSITAVAQPITYYVNSLATGSNDGSNWTHAFTSLQAGIDAAAPGDSVWVAAGMYFPTTRINGDSARNATFYINKDILVYGGFAGTPGTEGQFATRNTDVHPTILSGDIGIANDSTDNAFHVVYIDHVSDTMRLDGFIIEKGNTREAVGFDAYGGGIFNNARLTRSNPVIANTVIRNNYAAESGGGIMNFAEAGGTGNLVILNSRIEFNEGGGGGGMQNYVDGEGESSPVIINSYFRGNTARTAQGSAISTILHSSTGDLRMINSIVTGNHANGNNAFDVFVTGTGRAAPMILSSVFSGNTGGAIRITDLGEQQSTITVRNSILSGNPSGHGLSTNGATEDIAFSIVLFGAGGEGVIGLSPEFVDAPATYATPHNQGDVHLLPTSPGLDAGRNSDFPPFVFSDAAGNPRIVNSTGLPNAVIDIGAFEYQDLISSVRDEIVTLDWQVSPNPTTDRIRVSLAEHSDFHAYLLDMNGTVIREFKLAGNSTTTLDVQALLPGIYTMMATDAHRIANIRFVKE